MAPTLREEGVHLPGQDAEAVRGFTVSHLTILTPAECGSMRALSWWLTAMWSWTQPCEVAAWGFSASPRRTSSGLTCVTAAMVSRGPTREWGVCPTSLIPSHQLPSLPAADTIPEDYETQRLLQA